MKKLIALCILHLAFLSGPASAGALMDIYAGGTFGGGGSTAFTRDDVASKPMMSYGAIVGLDIPVIRAEAEYNYLNGKYTDLHMGMLNAYVKLPSELIVPYLGVGIGAVLDGETHTKPADTAVAYQGMVGITFEVPILPLKIDTEARAMYIPDILETDNDDQSPDLLNYDLRIKARYIF